MPDCKSMCNLKIKRLRLVKKTFVILLSIHHIPLFFTKLLKNISFSINIKLSDSFLTLGLQNIKT